MTLPLLTAYAGQCLVLLAAIFLCLALLYACLWLGWRIYKTVQGWPLILAAVRHYAETHPEEFAAIKLVIKGAKIAGVTAQPGIVTHPAPAMKSEP